MSDGEPVGSLEGLVLLDLPDFDSRETAHRAEAERVLALCDVFVWSPTRRSMRTRCSTTSTSVSSPDTPPMLVVLNQVDRLLSESAVEACREDLVRLLKADGVEGVQVLTTSVATGRASRRFGNGWPTRSPATRRLGSGCRLTSRRSPAGFAEGSPKARRRSTPPPTTGSSTRCRGPPGCRWC